MNPPTAQAPAIPREVRTEFQARIDREFTARGALTTADQVQILEDLLERCRTEGETPAGDGWLSVDRTRAVDYTNPLVVERAAGGRAEVNEGRRWAFAGVLVGAAALFFIVYYLVWPRFQAAVAAPTPTVGPTPPGGPTPTALPVAPIKIGEQDVPAVFPVSVQIGAQSWVVNAAGVDAPGGNWDVRQEANLANWLDGSLVNWVFGFWDDATGRNAALFADLSGPATPVIMRMSSGVERHYAIGAAHPLDRFQTAIFAQHQPGMTLVLLGSSGPQRQVALGQEVTAAPAAPAGTPMPPVPPAPASAAPPTP